MVDFEQRALGLTWSERWHVIDQKRSNDTQAVAHCGAYLYVPAEVLEKGSPRHLRDLLQSERPLEAAPMCKKCDRKVRATADAAR